MSSCAASYCTCFRKVSCVSATSASWPIADAPLSCRLAFNCSVRYSNRTQNKKRPLPMNRALFGSVPSVAGLWSSSRDLLRPRSNSVLHPSWPRLPHETAVHNPKTLRASLRSVPLRLAAEQISSSPFSTLSVSDNLALLSALGRTVLSSALRRTAPAYLDTALSLH